MKTRKVFSNEDLSTTTTILVPQCKQWKQHFSCVERLFFVFTADDKITKWKRYTKYAGPEGCFQIKWWWAYNELMTCTFSSQIMWRISQRIYRKFVGKFVVKVVSYNIFQEILGKLIFFIRVVLNSQINCSHFNWKVFSCQP